MLSSNPDSSPLSSPPSSLASSVGFPSPNGFLPSHETIEPNPVPLIEDQSPIVPSVSALGSEAGSPSASTADITANLAPKQSPKRVLEEVEEAEENTPPPKKRKYQPKAAGRKTKAAPLNKITAETATATESSVTPKPSARKKATPAPPTQSTRPTRNRKAPERFEEEQPAPKATPRRGPSKVFDPVFITTNSTSRLVKADVYHMLLESSSWTSLTTEQQTTLLKMLPQTDSNQALLSRLVAGENEVPRPQVFTISNTCFRTDVAKFKEDLKNGHLAKTWQAAAEQAVSERASGKYDDWKMQEAEQWWGQKGKLPEV
ncbi:hypothetical protein IQ07DRAFT_498556 [Pyrenochaeta sp. DS3sAY3a]|nr:hypothetical protein IQ07DRAFT_498556 [Pyrenochaeta sp. DS3sAY3a]